MNYKLQNNKENHSWLFSLGDLIINIAALIAGWFMLNRAGGMAPTSSQMLSQQSIGALRASPRQVCVPENHVSEKCDQDVDLDQLQFGDLYQERWDQKSSKTTNEKNSIKQPLKWYQKESKVINEKSSIKLILEQKTYWRKITDHFIYSFAKAAKDLLVLDANSNSLSLPFSNQKIASITGATGETAGSVSNRASSSGGSSRGRSSSRGRKSSSVTSNRTVSRSQSSQKSNKQTELTSVNTSKKLSKSASTGQLHDSSLELSRSASTGQLHDSTLKHQYSAKCYHAIMRRIAGEELNVEPEVLELYKQMESESFQEVKLRISGQNLPDEGRRLTRLTSFPLTPLTEHASLEEAERIRAFFESRGLTVDPLLSPRSKSVIDNTFRIRGQLGPETAPRLRACMQRRLVNTRLTAPKAKQLAQKLSPRTREALNLNCDHSTEGEDNEFLDFYLGDHRSNPSPSRCKLVVAGLDYYCEPATNLLEAQKNVIRICDATSLDRDTVLGILTRDPSIRERAGLTNQFSPQNHTLRGVSANTINYYGGQILLEEWNPATNEIEITHLNKFGLCKEDMQTRHGSYQTYEAFLISCANSHRASFVEYANNVRHHAYMKRGPEAFVGKTECVAIDAPTEAFEMYARRLNEVLAESSDISIYGKNGNILTAKQPEEFWPLMEKIDERVKAKGYEPPLQMPHYTWEAGNPQPFTCDCLNQSNQPK